MRLPRRLLLALVAIVAPVLGWAQSAAIGSTYRAQAGDAVLLVRTGDEQIDLLHLGTGKSASVAAFPTPDGLSGVSSTGEVVSLGNVLGKPVLLVGSTLLPLARIGAAEYAAAQAAAQRARPAPASATGGPGGSLGGVALLYAKSSNGYGQMKRFDFCSDGSFFYHFEELQSSQLGRAAGDRNDSGTWSLEGNSLTVRFRGQGARSYALVMRSSGSVSLDGAVFAVQQSGRCR